MSSCQEDRLKDLVDISLDEVAWRKRHKYLTLAGGHDQGYVVWGSEGNGQAAADEFFDALDPPPAKQPADPGRSRWEPEPAIMVPFGPCLRVRASPARGSISGSRSTRNSSRAPRGCARSRRT